MGINELVKELKAEKHYGMFERGNIYMIINDGYIDFFQPPDAQKLGDARHIRVTKDMFNQEVFSEFWVRHSEPENSSVYKIKDINALKNKIPGECHFYIGLDNLSAEEYEVKMKACK